MAHSQRPVRTSFVLATLITLAAAVPLAILALDTENEEPAPSTGLFVTAEGSTTDLSGSLLAEGTVAVLSIDADDVVAVTWTLFDSSEDAIAGGTNLGAPPYSVDLSPLSVADLKPGLYELLVSETRPDGSVAKRAARFAIDDSA